MRTTVTIDDDVYQAARANAHATGRSIGRVLSEMARTALPAETPAKLQRARFPTFDVPEGSRTIVASKIQALLDEHGIV